MGIDKKEIGSLTRISKTVYIERPCEDQSPHPKHSMGGASGGGSAAGSGPHYGDVTLEGGTSYEFWCLGVRGSMQV